MVRPMAKNPDQQIAYFLYTLKRFRNYVSFSENSWEQYLNEYKQSLRDDTLSVAKFGGRHDHWADLAQTFPQYHRRASFLMLFAMFEDDLNQFCKSIGSQRKLTKSLKQTRGQGIERAKTWLKNVAHLNLAAVNKEWARILQFRDVRNVLVHASGFLETGNDQHERVKKFAKTKGSQLELHHHARTEIVLKSKFLLTVINTLETFYKSLLQIIT
jgi:hypothetical protein